MTTDAQERIPVELGETSRAAGGADDGRQFDVVGIGSALVDVLAPATDELLASLGLQKGSMALVDLDRSREIHDTLVASGSWSRSSGGSVANTLAGVAALGGRAGHLGKVGGDDLGEAFTEDIRGAGVLFEPKPAAGATGRCLVLVSDDAERTMVTHLGVASTFGRSDVADAVIAASSLLYIEGYLWDAPEGAEALEHAIGVAHEHDVAVALTVSDALCVERHRSAFLELLDGGIDVLFANEIEAMALFRAGSVAAAVDAAAETGLLAVLTLGAEGSTVVAPDGTLSVPAHQVGEVVDTTGAGDLYAAGFLHGLTQGMDPERCARLGALCAAEVISHVGARPVDDLRSLAAALLGG